MPPHRMRWHNPVIILGPGPMEHWPERVECYERGAASIAGVVPIGPPVKEDENKPHLLANARQSQVYPYVRLDATACF